MFSVSPKYLATQSAYNHMTDLSDRFKCDPYYAPYGAYGALKDTKPMPDCARSAYAELTSLFNAAYDDVREMTKAFKAIDDQALCKHAADASVTLSALDNFILDHRTAAIQAFAEPVESSWINMSNFLLSMVNDASSFWPFPQYTYLTPSHDHEFHGHISDALAGVKDALAWCNEQNLSH
jgi:hypothetical protein